MTGFLGIFNKATPVVPPVVQPDVTKPMEEKPAVKEDDKPTHSEPTPIGDSGGKEYRIKEAKKYINALLPKMVAKVKEDNYDPSGPNLTQYIKLVMKDQQMSIFKDEIEAQCQDLPRPIRSRTRVTDEIFPADPFEVHLRQLLNNGGVVQDETVAGGSLVSDNDLNSMLIHTDYEWNELETSRKAAYAEVDRRNNLARELCSSMIIEALSLQPSNKL